MKELLSKVMKRAWEIKNREDLKVRNRYLLDNIFTVPKEEYMLFSACLVMAWKEIKKEESDKLLSFDDIMKIAEKKARELGYDKADCNNWVKAGMNRTYIQLISYGRRKMSVTKCGYFDNNTNEYVAFDRYSKVLDLLA